MAFLNESVEVPETWSQVATDIIAQKYFRKAGVPSILQPIEEEVYPSGYGAASLLLAQN